MYPNIRLSWTTYGQPYGNSNLADWNMTVILLLFNIQPMVSVVSFT